MITPLIAFGLLASPAHRTATIQAIPAATPTNSREMLGGPIASHVGADEQLAIAQSGQGGNVSSGRRRYQASLEAFEGAQGSDN